MEQRDREEKEAATDTRFEEDRKFRRLVTYGWIIVCSISVLFVLYGFIAFFVVGDKGPPDWEYGSVKDVPAESVYSTYPYRGRIPQPEPQHVDKRPAADTTQDISGQATTPVPRTKQEKEVEDR